MWIKGLKASKEVGHLHNIIDVDLYTIQNDKTLDNIGRVDASPSKEPCFAHNIVP